MAEVKKFYMCQIDWNHEIGACPVMLYESLEDLKKDHPCWKTCGVVEVEAKAKTVIKADRSYNAKKSN